MALTVEGSFKCQRLAGSAEISNGHGTPSQKVNIPAGGHRDSGGARTSLPKKLLFEADLWAISLELVIASAEATKMATKTQELGLDVERIIPAHGINANMEALKKGLAVRAKYAAVPSH